MRYFSHKTHSPDYLLIFTILALCFFGIAMVASASAVASNSLVQEGNYYFLHQGYSLIIGLGAFFITQTIDYHQWKKFSVILFAISIILLIGVFIPGIGAEYGTSSSWIYLPFFPSIQPVEIAKLSLIIYLASWISSRKEEVKSFSMGFIPFSFLLASLILLLALQPDFGSVLVIVIIGGVMYFTGGADLTQFLAGGGIGITLAMIFISTRSYLSNRFLAFINPAIDPEGIGYHIKQALIAVGSGGIFGLGFGYSRQKFNYLPEAQADSIFAIAAEELGFFRIIFIVLAFAFIAYKGFQIATRTSDRFGYLLAIGITTWITAQAFINIAVNLSLAPVTGITLPFISYGGSSLVMTLAAVGILVNISKNTESLTTNRSFKNPSITRRA